jgi:hypothetical protein
MGIASAWMGAACSKPSWLMAFNNSGDSPSSENNFGVMQILLQGDIIARKAGKGDESFKILLFTSCIKAESMKY